MLQIMKKESRIALRASKIARIIISLSELYNLPIEKAADIYYSSLTANLIEEGVSNLHCRSNKYLATVIWDEHNETLA